MKLIQKIKIEILRKSELNESQRKRALELIVKKIAHKAKDSLMQRIDDDQMIDDEMRRSLFIMYVLLGFASDIQLAVEKFHESDQLFFADTLEEYLYNNGDIIE